MNNLEINTILENRFEVITIDIGNKVVCDYCNKDYTDSDEVGGILFGSNAVCPICTPELLESIAKYKEEFYIKATANLNESFRDFVYRIRKGT